MEYENLFLHVAGLGVALESLYQNNKTGRRRVLEFMDANNWFGLTYITKDKTPQMRAEDLTEIRKPLTLWLAAYNKSGKDKLTLMLEHFGDTYPLTCSLYKKFVESKKISDKPAAWKLLDFLLSEIDREVTEYDEIGLEDLIKQMDNGATRNAAKLFADFLSTKNHKGERISDWTYSFAVRDTPEITNAAYPLDSFAIMAHCVFNEEMWEQQRLVEKAISNKACADLWLLVALHFVCALRASDMARLPAPALPYGRELVVKKIINKTFAQKEASVLADDLLFRLNLNPLHPSKTAERESVPEIKLFIPESLRVPLGTIIAIVLAHQPETCAGDYFVNTTVGISCVRRFFGADFIKALGGKDFSKRRCNKSYLQGIDIIGGDSPGKPKGYMLAALARSHKSGIGKLSETTDIYLRDAKFSGYTPEFIIRQMFERGVFSFIPMILLEMYAGSSYKKLSVSAQTHLITELGLSAPQVENLAEATERAMIRSRKAMNIILQKPPDIKKNLFGVLQNIASGNAPSRQAECLCLMTAAGFPCTFADRDCCIGCGYEIYTKSAIHTLMREYVWLSFRKNNVDIHETKRCELILEQAVMPAIAEMLSSMEILYPESDMTELLNIMEEGLDCIDCDERRNQRGLQPVNINKRS